MALEWLAGAGGFEPPYGGIKIRCLTTWRRPNGDRIRPARGRTIEAEVACRNRKADFLEQHLPLARAGSRRPEMGLVLPAGADYKGPVAAPWGRHVGV